MKTLQASALLISFFFIFSVTVLSQSTQTCTLVNKSGMVITSVSYSPAGKNIWSDNISTVEKLKNTESFKYGFNNIDPKNCTYDLKFKCDDGNDYVMKNVTLCSTETISLVKQK